MGQIPDGTSKTYCVGEKYLDPNNYVTGEDPADDQHIWGGHDRDVNGYSANDGLEDVYHLTIVSRGDLPPLQDRPGLQLNFNFGSAHSGTFHMAFCDGSVKAISYSIDPDTHRRLGGRNDELVIQEGDF